MIIEKTWVSVISWFLKWSSCDIWSWCDNVGMQVWPLASERPKVLKTSLRQVFYRVISSEHPFSV